MYKPVFFFSFFLRDEMKLASSYFQFDKKKLELSSPISFFTNLCLFKILVMESIEQDCKAKNGGVISLR